MAKADPVVSDVVVSDVVAPKKYKVTIHSGETDSDKGDVVLCHNFRQILVQRDVEVTLDAAFVEECLAHSKIETIIKDLETGKERTVHIARYSYSASPV